MKKESVVRQIINLYSFSFFTKIRTYQRWYCGTPFEYVEQFVPKKGNIIDLGCGWGVFANLLAITSKERDVFGIDLDESKIKWAQKTVGLRENIKFQLRDLKSLNLLQIDAIILYDVMHHLEESVQFDIFKECQRKLVDGGILILKENDIVPKWKLMVSYCVEMLATNFNITLTQKILFRSKDEWRRLLEENDFKILHVEHINTKYGFFVPHLLFVCEKNINITRV